jgi:hypothetical protein
MAAQRKREILYYRPAEDCLGLEIQAALRADKAGGGRLRWCEPDPDGWEFDCYCAVAATAYLFLKGEELTGFDPLASPKSVDWAAAGGAAYRAGYRSLCSYGGGHWWLEYRRNGSPSQVIDLNIGLDDRNDVFDYVQDGHGQKFQGPGYGWPSKRALDLIGLVKENRARRAGRHVARRRFNADPGRASDPGRMGTAVRHSQACDCRREGDNRHLALPSGHPEVC